MHALESVWKVLKKLKMVEVFLLKKGCLCKKGVPKMKMVGSDMVHIQCKETCIILSLVCFFAPNCVEIF